MCYVKWVSMVSRQARRVRLDANDKVIALVGYVDRLEDFAAADVIVANTGIPMVHRRKEFRLSMATWCLLKVMHEKAKAFGGPMSPDCVLRCRGECVVCKCGQDSAVDTMKSVTIADVMVCSTCLSAWHVQCCDTRLFGKPTQRDDNSWVCAVCSQ